MIAQPTARDNLPSPHLLFNFPIEVLFLSSISMGTFVFKWEHAASEVYVTGTFDDWSKSEKLIQNGDVFEKNVTLPSADEKIYYKVR